MALEEALLEATKGMAALTEMLKITAQNQERLIAGQAAAIEKVQPETRTRTRAKKDEPTPAAAPAETETAEAPPPASTDSSPTFTTEVSDDELKIVASTYLAGEKDKGMEALQIAKDFIPSIAAEFGSPKLCGPESKLTPAERVKAWFFLKRKSAGLPVDFNGDYDFDGDPTQGGEPAAPEDDF
ncbi:hypothetical protein [Sphingobium lignivorans]|uniref:Membrane protein n=1 Tax=Sphingobium lignivorans TaxID=2735886 RepID=A0ABR6NFE6_9SPHN|nr:hypothetical protein [Sphingobium lignivorans]MBB5986007.1 putative membrane protein [Sphingobium lignivorans]